MAVLVREEHILEAVKEGRLMLLKRVNALANTGKSPARVLAEQLNKILNPLPEPPIPAVKSLKDGDGLADKLRDGKR